ncbi:MAG: serine--tRNA ligase [Rickettsiales bacterium]|nr:serine--tRNA ligase [Rickettsiales bacterium]
MHDIRWIRESPTAFDAAMKVRGLAPQANKLIALDEERRSAITKLESMQAERNAVAKQIGEKKRAGEDASEVMARAASLKAEIAEIEISLETGDALTAALEVIPNILNEGVPQGDDEDSNVEISRWGEPKEIENAKQHFDIGEALGKMDFETAAKLSGSRFVILRKDLARLERALANFMLDLHTQEAGYEETTIPVLVRDHTMYSVGQLPKFEEDSFKTTNDYRLIPTSEVALVGQMADSIVSETILPLRYTAYSQCFRSEAGSAGKDTRGMIRQHQFSKVELISIVKPEDSEAEFEHKLAAAERVLQRLELPYRVMLLCSGDTGFCAQKTYDLEVWLPGQNQYREISSVSNCGEFQARRMKARFRREGEKNTEFLHTLNGSGLAVGRTIVAILENYQQPDGSILVPKALQSYMGGLEKITA